MRSALLPACSVPTSAIRRELGRVARRRYDDLHRRHSGEHHVQHLFVWTPRPVAVGSKRDAHARRIQLRQVACLNPVKRLHLQPVRISRFKLCELFGRKARPQPFNSTFTPRSGRFGVRIRFGRSLNIATSSSSMSLSRMPCDVKFFRQLLSCRELLPDDWRLISSGTQSS
jgi:hypothetical protein